MSTAPAHTRETTETAIIAYPYGKSSHTLVTPRLSLLARRQVVDVEDSAQTQTRHLYIQSKTEFATIRVAALGGFLRMHYLFIYGTAVDE